MTEVLITVAKITSDACGRSGCITRPAVVLQENAFLSQTIQTYFHIDDKKGTAANTMQESDWIKAVKLEKRRSLMSHL